ncbi:MAG: hypothetical protein HY291_21855 [Planctomycetes bacterium]|nr:hypothetical protein [Planctomycetota bacterium]
MEHLIFLRADGSLQFIYADALRSLLEHGAPVISRASHVEPTADARWIVDLAPLGGAVLGPYEYREQALAAEAAWIESCL